MTTTDTGLGFAEFIASTSTEGSEPSPSGAEPTNSADPAPEPEPAKEEPAPAEGEEPSPPLAAKEEPKSEAIPPIPWDSDENPWKAKAEGLERQQKDTRDWATELGRQVSDLRRENEVIRKRLDGTYDPDTDVPEKPAAEVRHEGELAGKVRASVAVAERMFGKDKVQSLLFAEGAPFRAFDNDQAVQSRILAADAPALEAIQFLRERDFASKYGSDPDEIREKIAAEAKADLEKKLEAKLTKQIEERLAKRESQITGLGAARGTGSAVKPEDNGEVSFARLFPHLS